MRTCSNPSCGKSATRIVGTKAFCVTCGAVELKADAEKRRREPLADSDPRNPKRCASCAEYEILIAKIELHPTAAAGAILTDWRRRH